MANKMNARDAVYGSLAECYITIDGNRYNFMQLTEFESKYETNVVEVPILGQTNKGHKTAGGKGSWSGTAHYNQSIFRRVMLEYQNTGYMPYFDIQTTNEDPTSSIGRQTIIHKDCLMDTAILSKFSTGDDLLDEDISGTFERFEMPEQFKMLTGM